MLPVIDDAQPAANVTASILAATPSQRRQGLRFYDRAHRLALHNAMGENPGMLAPQYEGGPLVRSDIRQRLLSNLRSAEDPVARVHAVPEDAIRIQAAIIVILSTGSPAGMTWAMSVQAAYEIKDLTPEAISDFRAAHNARLAVAKARRALVSLKDRRAPSAKVHSAQQVLDQASAKIRVTAQAARQHLEGTALKHAGIGAILQAHAVHAGEAAPEDVIPMNNKAGAFFESISAPRTSDRAPVDERSNDILLGVRLLWDTDRGLSSAARHRHFEDAHRLAAEALGMRPSQAQAISWIVDKAASVAGQTQGSRPKGRFASRKGGKPADQRANGEGLAMSNEWSGGPEATILSLQRRRSTGEPELWTVSHEDDDLTVRHFWLNNGDSWRRTETGTGFTDLAEVLKRIPELRTLSRGTISEYTVDAAALEPPVLVSTLEAAGMGGAEVAGDWPDEVAREWAESDSTIGAWTSALDWVARWARVNDLRVSVINVGSPDDPVLRPVLIDEDAEQLVPIRQIARSIWHSESPGAPISWTGGNTLSLLAPGLGYNLPFEDSAEEWDGAYPFPDLPETPAELGKTLASWVIDTHSEVAAALALEPLDPDSAIERAEHRAWGRRLGEVTISFKINVNADAQLSLRKNLARLSELYRRTQDGLARPRSRNGQALAAALDDALDDGVVGRLTSGQWG